MHLHWTWDLNAPSLIGAAIAAAIAIWSAWSNHRVAGVARAERHDKLDPRIDFGEQDFEEDHEIVWLESDGPRDYTRVRFRLLPMPAPAVEALAVPERPDDWVTEGELGPLARGQRRFLRFRQGQPAQGGIVRVEFTCWHGRQRWTIVRQFEAHPDPTLTVF
jgi:hypothetical protein